MYVHAQSVTYREGKKPVKLEKRVQKGRRNDGITVSVQPRQWRHMALLTLCIQLLTLELPVHSWSDLISEKQNTNHTADFFSTASSLQTAGLKKPFNRLLWK